MFSTFPLYSLLISFRIQNTPFNGKKSFNFNGDCFLCETQDDGGEQWKKVDVSKVTTIEMKGTMLAIRSERRHAWGDAVQARMMHIHDLPAADAVYHQTRSVNFRTGKQIPKVFVTEELAHKKKRLGRPQDKKKRMGFFKTMMMNRSP